MRQIQQYLLFIPIGIFIILICSSQVEAAHLSIGATSSSGPASEVSENNTVTINTDDPWSMNIYDGNYEDGLPTEIYEKIKGKYFSEVSGITIEVISEKFMSYRDGGYNKTLRIYGCEADGNDLDVYVVSYDEDYQNIFTFYYSEDGTPVIALGSGTWDKYAFHVTKIAYKIE